ncbi:MAG TPA: hypothetical protein VFI08_14405 [Spirochaetia bacterium]|nr:hypothetical protein [Spirochaetia bacterium]
MPREEMPGFIRVHHEWTSDERWNAVASRLGRRGERSRVPPGLYALGSPGEESPVIVTASYRLTFDLLRRDLAGIDGWILVLDTRGLDVGSAVAAGRFATDELCKRVLSARLSDVVLHRRLLLPMRSASAVDRQDVERATGFQVLHGPDRSTDVKRFLAGEPVPDRPFTVRDALVLTPAELGRALAWFPGFAFAALLFAGLGPDGVQLDRAFAGSWPLLVLGLALAAGASVLAPLLSAALPFVPLWTAGLAAGLAVDGALLEAAHLAARMDRWLHAACWLFFPCAGAWVASRFRRAMPVPAGGGAARPGRPPAVLVAAAALIALLVLAALVLSKSTRGG